ncbi:peptidoglycan DD-metalloendopeptidase family protein [Pelotomaculum schinkii]|uniref:peptidoglycan DD-metalloendopeptidase family protein n=1 Tax=Pelotomaculum schinkii TaxID=78350 RepID=UPI00167C94D9|nr:peptidoglycan DD-metalloendopeptidase family protein [Pelotomaculum schinkii]
MEVEKAARVAFRGADAVAATTGMASGRVGAAKKIIGDKLLEKATETAFKYKDYWWGVFIPPLVGMGAFFFLLVSLILLFMPIQEQGFNGGSPSVYALAKIPPEYLQIFMAAQKKYDVAWNVLAAIASVESNFRPDPGLSVVGAVGFMQFMPTTWSGNRDPLARDDPSAPSYDTDPKRIASYGGYGEDADGDGVADPYNPWDAVFAAAHLLKANGFHEDPRKAIYAYNHAEWYVDKILDVASTFTSEMLPDATAKGLPVPKDVYLITSPFGNRPNPYDNTRTEFHQGIDIGAPLGTQVLAVNDGTVLSSGWNDGFGLEIVIDHGSYKTQYAHLEFSCVQPGDKVVAGDVIGAVGSSGRSTGPHLHFGVNVNGTWSDPEVFLGAREEAGK